MAKLGVTSEPVPASAGGAGAAEPRRRAGVGATAVLNTAETKVNAIERSLGKSGTGGWCAKRGSSWQQLQIRFRLKPRGLLR
eukprot:6003785-Heterocapsa_arctica.AAC.1